MRVFFIILFLLPITLNAQPKLSGTWKGIITQNEGGWRSNYDFELVIDQDGKTFSGRSIVRIDDIYAVMEMQGEISNDAFVRFQESRIMESKSVEGIEWCIKRGQLLLKQEEDGWKLEGFWQGSTSFSTCIPGKIFLKKVKPRA